jgi:hypothetical protein
MDDAHSWGDGRKPNFFILGAPKCGTTSLAAWLAEHPNVCMSRPKEPKFFSRDVETSRMTPEDYAACFAHVSDQEVAIGEASPRYLMSAEAVDNILRFQPDARFIVCLRNPVEMVQSYHDQSVYNGDEKVADFETAWRREAAGADGRDRWPPQRRYRYACATGSQVARLMTKVEADRVHFVLTDDMKQAPDEVYRAVCGFLGVEQLALPEFPQLNASKTARSRGLKRLVVLANQFRRRIGFNYSLGVLNRLEGWNRVYRPRQPISAAFEAELKDYFRPEIELLSRHLGRDLSHWLKPAPASAAAAA